MDPYAGHMYAGNAHLQNQPQIVTNHYGSLNYPRNRVVYGGNGTAASYDNPYNSDPEWQYPATHHTLKPSSDGRYSSNPSPHPTGNLPPNYLSGAGGHPPNGPPNPYLQQHQQHYSPNNYHLHHQNSPNRIPMNIANTYNGGVVMGAGNPNHPDVAVNGPNNLTTINHTNYLGNHTVSGGVAVAGAANQPHQTGDGQHAVVRQLQEKFGGVGGLVGGIRGNGEAGSDVATDENYGCEPDSVLQQSRNNHIRAHNNHNHITNNGGVGVVGAGAEANSHHNSSNGGVGGASGGGTGGLNGVIPGLCCASEKDVGTDEGSENESSICLRSLWVHCRLSVLLVLVVILLILFLSFSGALLYFKSK